MTSRGRIATWLAAALLLCAALGAQQTADELAAEARRAFNAGDYERAADLSKRVYELRRANGPADDLEIATAALNAGVALRRAGKAAEAVPYIETACNAAADRFGAKHERVGGCLLELADTLAAAKQQKRAEEVAAGALAIIEAALPAEAYAAAVFHAGEIFQAARDVDAAVAYFQRAAKLYAPGALNRPDFAVTALADGAQLLYEAKRFADAVPLLEQATAIERSGARSVSLSYLLADCYRQIGDYDKALVLLGSVAQALTSVHTGGHVSAGDVLLQIAQLQYDSGGSSEALATLQGIMTTLPPAGRRSALYLAGGAYSELHEYAEAEQSFRTAVDEARAPGGEALSDALSEFGFFMLRRGRYAEAHNAFAEALPIVEGLSGKKSVDVASILEKMAVGLINQGDCESARPVIERARRIHTKQDPQSAGMLRALALASFCAASPAAKSSNMAEALRLQKTLEGEDSVDWLVASASFYRSKGELANAAAAAQRALTLKPSDAAAKEVLANVMEERGQFADAAKLFREVIAAAAERYGDDSLNVAARRFNLGRTLLRAQDRAAARDAFLAAAGGFVRHAQQQFTRLSLAEQRQLLAQETAVQVSGVLTVCHDDPCLAGGYAVMAPWKGLVVESLRRQSEIERSMQTRAGDNTAARLRKVRRQLALWASSRESRMYDEWKKKNDALTAEKEALERALLGSTDALPYTSTNILDDLRSVLRPAEVFVDIYKFDQFGSSKTFQATYGAVITDRMAPPRFVTIGSAKQIDALVASWIAGVRNDRADAAWAALKARVWEPLRRALPPGTHAVRVSGDGDLVPLPWHAFSENGSGALDVVEVDSARSLLRARSLTRPSAAEHVVIVGGLDYDAGRTPKTPGWPGMPFQTLSWTKEEASAIENLAHDRNLQALWLKDAAATKSAVLGEFKRATWVHLATHGFVPVEDDETQRANTPLRTPLVESGLALSGANTRNPDTLQSAGILTAEEILDADMTHAKLVVLSACNTALGIKASGQGILGLRSSLNAAGARRLVMSLWPVDDEATQLLMRTFYRKLWVERKPLLQAFHEAQDAVRATDRFATPRFWAGWSIVDPD
ncbi:MAG TPA: CHAT domain-containing protein [Thermoanaerobaculia bacterium]|nr:CHAT domain-containing protein [Thermoanaerobaculia bacterium]